MKKVKFQINYGALGAATRPHIERLTSQIAQNAGEGFVGDVRPGRGRGHRPHGVVRANTYKAQARNARDNTLLKAAQSV